MTQSVEQLAAESNDDFTPFNPADMDKELKDGRLNELKKYRSSKQGRAVADWVRQQHDLCKNNRVTEERQWALNLAQYKGRADLSIIPEDPRIDQRLWNRIGKVPVNEKNKKRINRIRPMIRTELARLISQKPSSYVVPTTSEDADLFAALAGEQAWESIQVDMDLQVKFAKAAFWLCITGTSFMKTWWDSYAKDPIFPDITGKICADAPSPFHIFVIDKVEQDIESQPYVIHAFAKPRQWALHRYRDELAGESLSTTKTKDDAIVETSVLGVVDNEVSNKDSVIIYEAWVKPGATDLLPKGALVTLVNNVMVGFHEGLPYDHQQYPFVKFEHMPTETFYADSVIVDVAPINAEYNETRSRIGEAIKKMSSLQILAPQGSIVPQKITNETGQVILYKPGMGKPEPFPVQNVPAYVLQSLDRQLLDIEDISGQHQVSKGNVPPGVTAATAISYLQEKDESYFVHTVNSVEKGMEKLGRQSLQLAVQYWTTPRAIRTVGEDSAFDIQVLSGADIKHGVDLRIEGGSALPQSKSAKQALIMDLMSQGFIPPEEGLKILEIGGPQKIGEQLRVDERQAQRENLRMRRLDAASVEKFNQLWTQQAQQISQQVGAEPTGISPTGEGQNFAVEQPPSIIPVNDWDNHAVHIEIHNRFRKSQAFDLLPSAVKEQFQLHVTEHENKLAQTVMDQFMGQIPGDGSEEDSAFDPNNMAGDMEAQMAPGQQGIMTPPGGNEQPGGPPTEEGAPQNGGNPV